MALLLKRIRFPPLPSPPYFRTLSCNMLPFVMGDSRTIPAKFRHYGSLVEQCPLSPNELGRVGYLTVHESWVAGHRTQRRPGLHVERHPASLWGGGSWSSGMDGTGSGIYMTNNLTGSCRVWNTQIELADLGKMGDVEHLRQTHTIRHSPVHLMRANELWWMTDRTPHEALSFSIPTFRRFFRLVTSEVDVWYSAHSTHNFSVPLPDRVRIIHGHKFR